MRSLSARDNLAVRLRKAFLLLGYEAPTMGDLAKTCGLTRRALYHHVSSKEEAFRLALLQDNDAAIVKALQAGRALMVQDAGPAEVFIEIMNVRYGDSRRELAASPHGTEFNAESFIRGRDIMIETAVRFQAALAELAGEMEERGQLRLNAGTTPALLAQMLCDGARGAIQALPPVVVADLPNRYRLMCGAILFGCARPGA